MEDGKRETGQVPQVPLLVNKGERHQSTSSRIRKTVDKRSLDIKANKRERKVSLGRQGSQLRLLL